MKRSYYQLSYKQEISAIQVVYVAILFKTHIDIYSWIQANVP